MDKLVDRIFYLVFYGIFFLIGKLLRFTFDVLVYLITLGYHRYKPGGSHNPTEMLFPLEARFEHTHIVGGSGHGKTQLMQTMILRDMHELVQGNGSIVVIDSQGDMIKNILSTQLMATLKDRVILIDPTDVNHPPALNLFDFGLSRLDTYDAAEREKLLNSAVALYEYLFGALLGAELTARQGMIFRYLARLMMVVPGATIHTFMDFVANPETTIPYYDKLDRTTRLFFQTQFSNRTFDETRQQILTRLWIILSNGILERMFSSEKNAINLFSAMNSGSLILINTAKDLLKQDGCELLGRFFIALIAQATQERAIIPPEKRRATFVYIDEAHDYFDESLGDMLNQARKFKVGLVFAHQNLDQLDASLRATVMSSTSIKIFGGLSAKDTNVFAQELGEQPEQLRVEKTDKQTQFICAIRNHGKPTYLRVPFREFENMPQLTAEQQAGLRDENRKRYCTGLVEEPMRVADRAPLSEPEMI